jgi:predicted acylesterase/phospholipase RssA
VNRFSRGGGPFCAALLAIALLSPLAHAARDTVVRVALPPAYEAEAQKRANEAPRCLEGASPCGHTLRYRYAVGTDYQVLDWLQNGKVDAAVVSALTLELLRRSAGEKFERDFFVAAKPPWSSLSLQSTQVRLRANKDGTVLPEAEAEVEFRALFGDLLAGRPRQDVTIELSSHLSAGMPELFARARHWLKSHPENRGNALDTLMAGVVERVRFSFDRISRTGLRFSLAEESGTTPQFFVAHRSALPELITSYASLDPTLSAEATFLDYLGKAKKTGIPNSELTRFAAANYVKESIGWRTRFLFAFTLEEVRGLLRLHEPTDVADDGIALVLTGGGVKAAYQTKLIDHLYGAGFLHNRFAAEERAPHAVPVKYVIGTSGGALLGVFVASLDGSRPKPELSTKLWNVYKGDEPARLLSSGDVFPKVDMLRWLSLLACMAIFGLVCWALSHIRRWSGDSLDGVRDGPGRFWRLSIWWLLLLGVTPWLLIYVNGQHGQEHIPAVQGLFYFLYVLIAIHSDNRFITIGEPRVVNKRGGLPIALGMAGAALVSIAVGLRAGQICTTPLTIVQNVEITPPALLACIGVLFVFWSMHWWLLRRARWLQPVETRAASAFALLIAMCFLSYVPVLTGQAPVLELTLDFWIYLALSALVVSLVLAALSYWERPRFLKRFFDFLLSRHPAQASGTGRHARIIWSFVVAWLWWNLAVAPGAYGNDNARHYFKEAAKNVFGEAKIEGDSLRDVQFNAFYIAPITDLHERIERYVMFQPHKAYESGVPGALLGGHRNWASISNDARWFLIESPEQQAELVLRVAFASGSPFPVFPPHRIALGAKATEQKLFVDGGYAHNVPVEAAKRLGARRVLVISSSPRPDSATPNGKNSNFKPVGDFAWMLRMIVPYLYERSQVEDALSAEDLLVASVAPSASANGWPFLTDFRDVVIDRMLNEAEDDVKRRIGTIENWAQPSFERRTVAR